MLNDGLNNQAARVERIVAGALKSAIATHGPITSLLLTSAAKRIVGQLLAEGQTRIAIPVITTDQVGRLEHLADRFEALVAEMQDVTLPEIANSLALLRDDHHPEGWSEVEVVERADAPVAIVHHYTVGRAPKHYKRKRDGKTVELRPADDAVDRGSANEHEPSTRV